MACLKAQFKAQRFLACSWMIHPKSLSLVTSNLTLMTLRYISRLRQKVLIHVYAKLMWILNMLQSGVVKKNCKLHVYPRSTLEFIWTRLNVSVRSRSNWNFFLMFFFLYTWFEPDLPDHIASLTSSFLSTSAQINMVRHFFFKDVLYIILNSLVFSKLFYCSTAWYETSKENIHKLQLTQNFVSCVLTNTKKFDHITPVIHELGWLTIEELLRLRDVKMIFKFRNGLVPSYWVSTKLVKRADTHSYCTGQSNQLNFSQCRTFAAKRAFPFRASKYWKSISNNIRNSASVEVFKGIARLEIIRMSKYRIYS